MTTRTLAPPLLSVSDLNLALKGLMEQHFSMVYVKGEITNIKEQSSGHIYFSLKDDASQISAVLFRTQAIALSKPPKAGDQVRIKGQLSLYLPRGSYQIVVKELEFSGIGDLLLKLHELKLQLEKAGYFDAKRKKPLPKYPRKIGVITSPSGAVIQDIIHVLKRRAEKFHLILYPVRVQGAGAEQEIAQAIIDCNRLNLADVLIVGRGGGSIEDLWCFNELCVAEAIFNSKIPIISAIGHETDFTIADFVADIRAPTPSAAAEIISQEYKVQMNFLLNCHKKLLNSDQFLGTFMQKLDEIESRLDRYYDQWIQNKCERFTLLKKQHANLNPSLNLQKQKQACQQISHRQDFAILQSILRKKRELKQLQARIEQTIHLSLVKAKKNFSIFNSYQRLNETIAKKLFDQKNKLTRLVAHLNALDPKTILKKGYCIPFAENNHSVIMSTYDLVSGQKVRLLFHDGSALASIDQINLGD